MARGEIRANRGIHDPHHSGLTAMDRYQSIIDCGNPAAQNDFAWPWANKPQRKASGENIVMITGTANGPSKRPSMSPITPIVFIVDDDISVRESLAALVRYTGWQVASFASAQEFLDHPPVSTPSCLVLDISLPDLNGLDLQERIATDRIDMPIIFITGYGDIPMTVRAMKAGAVEFLIKPLGQEALLTAIRNALARSESMQGHKVAFTALQDRYASLSGRQREVMALVALGLLNKQIAGELGISEITVKAHRGRVMRKMDARSIASLVTMAASLGLCPNGNGKT